MGDITLRALGKAFEEAGEATQQAVLKSHVTTHVYQKQVARLLHQSVAPRLGQRTSRRLECKRANVLDEQQLQEDVG